MQAHITMKRNRQLQAIIPACAVVALPAGRALSFVRVFLASICQSMSWLNAIPESRAAKKAGMIQRKRKKARDLKWYMNSKRAKGMMAPASMKGNAKRENSNLVSSLKVVKVNFCFGINSFYPLWVMVYHA